MIIKTMQLVGARKGFIRGPFIRTYLYLGIISAVLACSGVWGLLQTGKTYLPDLNQLMDTQTVFMSFGGILFLSVLITSLSARLATQRYLNLKTDYLY
jgi:cell division transport system permease protein